MAYREYNFDGLVGPTHNYAGLSAGNLASQRSARQRSHPRAAALQGLAKMRALAELGIPQAILPPQRRPDLAFLRSTGLTGSDEAVIVRAARASPHALAAAYSASAMWTANAATVSPSPDTADGRLHLTPANLVSQRHRATEPPKTLDLLRQLFADERFFVVHPPRPEAEPDEGAANHTRLTPSHGERGVEVFTFGVAEEGPRPQRFVARQTRRASERIAAAHGVDAFFVQQLPEAIDGGVFHNDVIAVGNERVLLIHERAWLDQAAALAELRDRCGGWLSIVEVSEAELSLPEAVASYLFNSQLVTLPDGSSAIVHPTEVRDTPAAQAAVERIVRGDSPIARAVCVDVRESMSNGGGPACLRLRVVLSDEERAAVRGNVFWTPDLHARLTDWVTRHYRESLDPADLADPSLMHEADAALDELETILGVALIAG